MAKGKKTSVKTKNPIKVTKTRVQDYLKRRPHRSFRFTKRRDYTRSLRLPKYWAFTIYVCKTLWTNKKIFLLVSAFYAIFISLLVGISSQDTYNSLSDVLKSTSGDALTGFFGKIGGTGLLLASTMTGGLSTGLSDVQQIYAGLIALFTWLTSVWLLRNVLAGNKVKLRDGIYNSGSPIIPTFLVALIILVQLLPLTLAMIGFGAATSTGLLSNGVEAMLFWIAAGLLTALSIYLVTGTIFALIIVTLPGMYPMQAIKASGDLVIGRRVRILLRLVWMALIELILWALIMIPIMLLNDWLVGIWSPINNLPVVPVCLLMMSALTIVWTSAYVYLLYRKVVADDAEPA